VLAGWGVVSGGRDGVSIAAGRVGDDLRCELEAPRSARPTQPAQEPKARIGNCEADNDGSVHRPFDSFDWKIGECAKGKNRNITDE
jgi:hypothetical protein